MPVTPLNIKDPEAYRLATEIAQLTGKTLTRVVVDALTHERQALKTSPEQIDMQKVEQILTRLHSMTDVDPRPASEIVRELYDEHGLPR
jgi:antitoxin VapB